MRPGDEALRVNATWSVKIERLRTQLRVGVDADEQLAPQPVWVTLHLRGMSAACPASLSECIDYAPLCRFITDEWPRTPHIALLETRVNELVAFAFQLDARVQEVRVELAKERLSRHAVSVGIERRVARPEFEAQRRHMAAGALSATVASSSAAVAASAAQAALAAPAVRRPPTERTSDEHQHAAA
jgi:dihydroneopterin aldolase